MIGFRNFDARYPFLWEGDLQPAGRWHALGEGPAQYLADTPDGAWAEFLRHEEITALEDLAEVRRGLCAVEFDEAECEDVALPLATMTGGVRSYVECQMEAARMRSTGSTGVRAPSAALQPGGAAGLNVRGGVVDASPRDGVVFVLYGPRPGLTGWVVVSDGRPPVHVLLRVAPLGPV